MEGKKNAETIEEIQELKWLGLVDDFRTFRIEKPDARFFEYMAA